MSPYDEQSYETNLMVDLHNSGVELHLSKNGWNLIIEQHGEGHSISMNLSSMMVEDWEALRSIVNTGIKRARRSQKYREDE